MRIFLLNGNKMDGTIYPLSEKEMKYISTVLRIREGTIFKAKDPWENLYDATLSSDTLILEKSTTQDNFLDTMPSYPDTGVAIHVFQCICKGKKNAQITRQLQEAGATGLNFISSKLVQQKQMDAHEIERLETIRNEAVQQSGAKICRLSFNIPFEEALKNAEGLKLLLHQDKRNKSRNLYDVLENNDDETISVLIGSEGGFTDEECQAAEDAGFIPVLLNTNILRAETAGIYVMGGIQSIRNR